MTLSGRVCNVSSWCEGCYNNDDDATVKAAVHKAREQYFDEEEEGQPSAPASALAAASDQAAGDGEDRSQRESRAPVLVPRADVAR